MDVVLLIVGAVGASAAVVTAWATRGRLLDARRTERGRAAARLREVRRGFYDDAQLGRLDNPRSRAELAEARFNEEEVEFIATWEKEWKRHASGKADQVEAWRPKREALEARLRQLLLDEFPT